MSDAYCLFGYPVRHSWSPFIHGLFARQTGQDMEYRLNEAPPDSFRHDVLEFFFDRDGRGCNVTLPHKRAAADIVNELSRRAQLAGAVNTIVRRGDELFGDNTDGIGLVTDLQQNLGLTLKSRRILVLGAGGAARGAVGPLLDYLRPRALVIANRTVDRATELAGELAALGPAEGVAFEATARFGEPFDLIVNATSASLQGEVPPIAATTVGPQTVCYDMAYGVGETSFTAWSKRRGARVVAQGWGMLVEQAAAAFELWRGLRPSTQPVLQALQDRAAALAAGVRQ